MSLSCGQPPLKVKLGIFTSLVKICKAQKKKKNDTNQRNTVCINMFCYLITS